MKKKSSPYLCNVLRVEAAARQLWQFNTRNSHVQLVTHRAIPALEPLPSKIVGKDWSTIFQRKLNIAWLPADHVFLRVVHLPGTDSKELLSMIELQLEKLSPLPINQIVWSMELLPQQKNDLQTLVVIIVSRSQVEEFLGRLETDGYFTDRLEVPCLHQLLELPFEGDGVWLYPFSQGEIHLCLIAWWCGGALQQLQLLHLPAAEAERPPFVVEQLTQLAWAGEVEGWLTSTAGCCLVADHSTAALWEPALGQWAGRPLTVSEAVSEPKLGELAARRAARGESKANLLPPEYAARYQQQIVDRLWMGGLGAVLAIYVVAVLIYFGAVQVLAFQQHRVQGQVAAIANDYTNTVRLKEQIEVLQNQLHLKYAALDCLRAVSEKLPADLTLNSFNFQQGRRVVLSGTAPPDQVEQLHTYNEDLRRFKIEGRPLFRDVTTPRWGNRPGPGGSQVLGWDFNLELNVQESQ